MKYIYSKKDLVSSGLFLYHFSVVLRDKLGQPISGLDKDSNSSWGLSNKLDAEASLQMFRQAVAQQGKPEIANSDQGSQFTCQQYVDYLQEKQIRISMDDKARAFDNIYIERFWRTIKYQHIYLNPADDGITLFQGISRWVNKYNQKPHQGINQIKPVFLYQMAA